MIEFIRREGSGQAMAEYTIIIALIALACIFAITAIGNAVNSRTQGVGKSLSGSEPECTVEHPCLH